MRTKISMKFASMIGALMIFTLACGFSSQLITSDGDNSADITSPVISNLSLSTQTVYYNEQGCGPDSLSLSVSVSDDSGLIKEVGVQYRVVSGTAAGAWQKSTLNFDGAGKFSGSINVASQANTTLNGADGTLVYQVYAMDTAGNFQTEPAGAVGSLDVKVCVSGKASSGSINPPPAGNASAPPPPSNNAGSNSPPANNPPSGNANNNNNNAGANAPSAGGDTTPPTITNVQDNGPVYYDGNSCGSTSLTLTARVTDNASSVTRVYVRYAFRNSSTGAGSNFIEKDMQSAGGGNYSLALDMTSEASALLNGADGVFEYQIMAGDGQNNWQTYPDANQPGGGHPAGIEVRYCGSAVGQPPQAPSSQPLTVSNVQPYPDTVYYGSCTSGEATVLQLQAAIEPLDQVQSAVARFGFIPQANMAPSMDYSASMYQLGIGDYAADIDVAATFTGQSFGDGFLVFVVEATNLQGQTTTSTGVMAALRECVSQTAPPVINFFTGPSANLSPGDSYTLQWDTSNANCGVELDGFSVNPSDSTSYGTDPNDNSWQAWTHTLTARGGDCNNPAEISEVVQITVEPVQSGSVSKGGGLVYNNSSLDLGDGNGDDIVFSHTSSGTEIYSVWGAQLAVWYGGLPTVSDCRSYIDAGAYTSVTIVSDDVVCYKTGSGNYGVLKIKGMFLDLNDSSNSNVDVSYETEIAP